MLEIMLLVRIIKQKLKKVKDDKNYKQKMRKEREKEKKKKSRNKQWTLEEGKQLCVI